MTSVKRDTGQVKVDWPKYANSCGTIDGVVVYSTPAGGLMMSRLRMKKRGAGGWPEKEGTSIFDHHLRSRMSSTLLSLGLALRLRRLFKTL